MMKTWLGPSGKPANPRRGRAMLIPVGGASSQPVERDVEGEHVHRLLAEDAQGPALRVPGHEPQDLIEAHSPRLGNPAGLDPCVRHRDLRIEPRAGRGDRAGNAPN